MPNTHVLSQARALVASLIVASTAQLRAEEPAWIAQSNANAQILLDTLGKLAPEMASRIGVRGVDDQITDFTPGADDRTLAAMRAARDALKQRLEHESHPLVRQDLEILIQAADRRIDTQLLQQKWELPYADLGQLIFFGEFSLLNEQVEEVRHSAALKRLQHYLGLTGESPSVFTLYEQRYLEKAADPKLLPPFKDEVDHDLAAAETYATGIRQLYTKNGIDKLPGATGALDALDSQLKSYSVWAREHILAKARSDFRLPDELYADNLKNVGITVPPRQLIGEAQLEFGEIRNEMKALATLVAKDHGYPDSDYRAVIRALKKDQISQDQVEPYYHEIISQIETIIRREKIVTLPERTLQMRLASPAETAQQPAPHFQPPPFVGAKGEQGIFVLTAGNPDPKANDHTGYDDFTFKAGAWTLTAHEGRPGHDLQFAAMLERGVSKARTFFAFNSVNVEGWALYAEAETKPYEPLDGQLIALQHRLMRSARAFLDPMLNLGLITKERAFQILTEEVCLSPAMAQQEVDRYTFRSPGQATAYFFGYSRLMSLRTATEVALGAKFDRQSFNDFIIGQGLLPPELLTKAVLEEYIPSALKKP